MNMKYEYLNRIKVTLHNQQQNQLSKETLKEINDYIDFEIYSAENMRSISDKGLIQIELNKLIQNLLQIRELTPDGSNQECMSINQICEFLGKLDMEDFRKIQIEALFIQK